MFLRELKRLKCSVKSQWMLLGDFNLIYKEQDKSNYRLNRQMLLRFRHALYHMEVKEVDLLDRKFTWSNNHAIPTLCRIDKVIYTPAWEDLYSSPTLQTLSSSSSDHCPLILMPHSTPPFKPIFRFEALWPTLPGYFDCVQQV
jgi:endonuclease/exonuclease/phosphatase family metal-dependent hydrolase